MSEKNYYKEVNDAFRQKRERAESERLRKVSLIHSEIPEVKAIDARLSKTGVMILEALQAEGSRNAETRIADIRAENDRLREERRGLLVAAGYPGDYTDVKYECEKCSDSGFVDIDMCTCMKAAIAEARLADSSLGRLSAHQSFDTFSLEYFREGEEREMALYNLKVLRDFAENFNSKTEKSWLLLGNTGLGKTHLSTAVGVCVIRRGYDVLYKTVQSVMDDFQQVQFRGGDAREIDKYYDCDLLIIDDLGVEMATQFTVSCIYNLINTRMNKRRSTMINTNLTAAEIRERYTDRIASRLFGEYMPLKFAGHDIRQQRLGRK